MAFLTPDASYFLLQSWFHTSSFSCVKIRTVEKVAEPIAPIVPPDSFEVPVFDLAKTQVSKITLPDFIFGVKVRPDLLHKLVRWYRNKARKGLARGKTRSEVKGSTRKIYKQKGTGRARASTIRNPIRKGGGKAHPPRGPRDYSFRLNKKVRRLALKSALAIKFAKRQLYILNTITPATHKTKQFAAIVKQFNWEQALLVEAGKPSETLTRATSNLKSVHVVPSTRLTVLSILKRKELVLSSDALYAIITKFSKWENRPLSK